MLHYIIANILLQEIVRTITFGQFLQYFFYLLGGVLAIWGIFKGFSTKASKASLKELAQKVEKKVEQTDFDRLTNIFEQFRIRHEQHNSEIQRLFYKRVEDLDGKFDKKFDSLKDDIIDILKKNTGKKNITG